MVPGATVKVTNVNTNVATKLTTNSAGMYSATSLIPGTYNVEADARGFKSGVVNGNGQGFTSPSEFGLAGIPDCLASVPNTGGGKKCGTPGVSINGYNGLGTGETLYEPANTLQFSDMVTKIAGRYNLKTGAEFRHYSINNYQPNGVTGSFAFNGAATKNGFADFLFGALNNGSSVQVQNTSLNTRAWAYAFFVQDDFKVTPKLTPNLGLRYQIDQSFHETHNGLAFFNPYTAQWEQFGVNSALPVWIPL